MNHVAHAGLGARDPVALADVVEGAPDLHTGDTRAGPRSPLAQFEQHRAGGLAEPNGIRPVAAIDELLVVDGPDELAVRDVGAGVEAEQRALLGADVAVLE